MNSSRCAVVLRSRHSELFSNNSKSVNYENEVLNKGEKKQLLNVDDQMKEFKEIIASQQTNLYYAILIRQDINQ